MRFFSFLLTIFIYLFLFAYPVKADGTYDCVWVPILGCRNGVVSCTVGYTIPDPSPCFGLDSNACVNFAAQACIPGGSTYGCKLSGGKCVPEGCEGEGWNMPDPTICSAITSTTACLAAQVLDIQFGCLSDLSLQGAKFKTAPPIEACGIETGIGCISISSEQDLATFFLGWGMGLGGGIALILIVISTFNIMTSTGDPKRVQAAKEMLTSALTGLILIVFCAYILNFIGVDLLGILG